MVMLIIKIFLHFFYSTHFAISIFHNQGLLHIQNPRLMSPFSETHMISPSIKVWSELSFVILYGVIGCKLLITVLFSSLAVLLCLRCFPWQERKNRHYHMTRNFTLLYIFCFYLIMIVHKRNLLLCTLYHT